MPSIFERLRNLIRPSNVIQISLGSDAPTSVLNYTAKALYQSQDNLQAVVNYLASSIAQLPLKVYRRNDENDRDRDRNSTAAKVLWKPNDYQTCFEFIRAVATEYYVFGCVYVWVTPDAENETGYQLRISRKRSLYSLRHTHRAIRAAIFHRYRDSDRPCRSRSRREGSVSSSGIVLDDLMLKS